MYETPKPKTPKPSTRDVCRGIRGEPGGIEFSVEQRILSITKIDQRRNLYLTKWSFVKIEAFKPLNAVNRIHLWNRPSDYNIFLFPSINWHMILTRKRNDWLMTCPVMMIIDCFYYIAMACMILKTLMSLNLLLNHMYETPKPETPKPRNSQTQY